MWSVPDEILAGLWAQMCQSGKAMRLFYNGTVRTVDEWISWLKEPSNIVVLVADALNKKIACVAWLNNAREGSAQVHFCMLGMPRAEIGVMALNYWASLGPLYVIVGITPESYTDAIRYAEKIGFKKKGEVTNLCNMVYEGRRESGVITEYLPRKEK